MYFKLYIAVVVIVVINILDLARIASEGILVSFHIARGQAKNVKRCILFYILINIALGATILYTDELSFSILYIMFSCLISLILFKTNYLKFTYNGLVSKGEMTKLDEKNETFELIRSWLAKENYRLDISKGDEYTIDALPIAPQKSFYLIGFALILFGIIPGIFWFLFCYDRIYITIYEMDGYLLREVIVAGRKAFSDFQKLKIPLIYYAFESN